MGRAGKKKLSSFTVLHVCMLGAFIDGNKLKLTFDTRPVLLSIDFNYAQEVGASIDGNKTSMSVV